MKVLVVSGFLGAGKTTFIQELARRTGRDFVVYENEYGQADIDAKVLSETDELSVWESTENCICCTGKQDFATSVLTIANTLDPEYLVVEPTGVARLSSVLENVDQVSYERIELLAPLVIVDAAAWTRQRDRYPDIYLDQVRTAPVVVVSKVERAIAGELAELEAWVRELNPGADIVTVPYQRLEDTWFEVLLTRLLGADGVDGSGDAGPGEPGFETISLEGVSLPTETHLIAFLDALVAGVYGEVVRAKGYLSCGSQWLRFDVVDRAWAITGIEAEDASLAVFIGPELRRPWLRETLLPLVRDAVATGDASAAEDDSLDYGHHHHHEHSGDCVCDECAGHEHHEQAHQHHGHRDGAAH